MIILMEGSRGCGTMKWEHSPKIIIFDMRLLFFSLVIFTKFCWAFLCGRHCTGHCRHVCIYLYIVMTANLNFTLEVQLIMNREAISPLLDVYSWDLIFSYCKICFLSNCPWRNPPGLAGIFVCNCTERLGMSTELSYRLNISC